MNEINKELKDIATDLNISNRIETMARKQAFITLKDHKENFENNPSCRLINPAKSNMGGSLANKSSRISTTSYEHATR